MSRMCLIYAQKLLHVLEYFKVNIYNYQKPNHQIPFWFLLAKQIIGLYSNFPKLMLIIRIGIPA